MTVFTVAGPSSAWMTCTGVWLLRCSEANTRRQSYGVSSSGVPSAWRAPAASDSARSRPRIVLVFSTLGWVRPCSRYGAGGSGRFS